MKIVRVWMLLVVVMGVMLGGCETGESPRVNDVAPPSGVEVVKPPAPSSETAAPQPSALSSPQASMDRLMREMEGKSPLPEESGVAVRHPDDRTQPHASTSGSTGTCPPAWFKREKKTAKFDGMGGPAESRESAEQRARLDVAKNIELDISGEDTSQVREATGQGFEYSVGSTIVERVNLSLTGLSITKVDTCGNQWYALAALDLAKASTAWGEDLRRLDDEAEAISQHVDTHEQNKAVFAELLAWYRLAVVRETASQIERRLASLTGKSESGPLRAGAAQHAKQRYENLIRPLEVKIVSGNNQRAVKQPALPDPFVVQVLAGTDPVAGVPVAFTVQKGTITLSSSRKITDKDGKVEVEGRYPQLPKKDEEDARIKVKVLLDEITKNYPDALKQLVKQKPEALMVKFQVRAPVFHLRQEALEMVDEAKELKFEIQAHETQGNILGVMKAMAELYKVQNMGRPVVKRLIDLHSASRKDVAVLRKHEETRDALESVLRSFKVQKVSGDNKQAVEGAALPEPFVVQVLAGTDPVVGVPVAFTVQKGTITLSSSRKITDKDGKVEVEGRYPQLPKKDEEDARIKVKVLLDEITKNYPDALKQLVKQKPEALMVKFQVLAPVFHLRKEARGMVDKAKGLKFEIQAHETKRDVLGVMKAMVELYKVQNMGSSVAERLLRLHPDSGKDVDALGDPDETRRELKDLVSSFQFTLVSGDQQWAKLGRPLKEPLKARLVAELGEETVPVAGVPVQFTFDKTLDIDKTLDKKDGGEIKTRSVWTNDEGYVHAKVLHVEPGDGKHQKTSVTVSLDDTRLKEWLPELLHPKFPDLKNNNLVFSITRPLGCKASDDFARVLYKMACALVSKGVRDEDIKRLKTKHPKTVVSVTKRGSKQEDQQESHLNARMEQSLRGGLSLTRQLTVLTDSNSGDASDAAVRVSGTYQISNKQEISVSVNFETRVNDYYNLRAHEIEKIPLKKLGKDKSVFTDDLRALSSSAHDLPVVPDPSGFATHDEWVKTFWTHHNPRAAFRTEVQPKKESYNDKENPRFSFSTKKKCYLWVFSIDVKGNVYMLLPNFYQKDLQLIRAGEWVTIPDPTKFSITIGHPFGAERVKTICTEHHIDIVAPHHVDELTNKDNPALTFSRENGRFSFVKAVSLTGAGEWSEAHTTVITLPKGQTMTQGMRGLQDLGLVSTEE